MHVSFHTLSNKYLFVQTTKLWNSDHGYQQTLQAFQQSLVNLGLEYGEQTSEHGLQMFPRAELAEKTQVK